MTGNALPNATPGGDGAAAGGTGTPPSGDPPGNATPPGGGEGAGAGEGEGQGQGGAGEGEGEGAGGGGERPPGHKPTADERIQSLIAERNATREYAEYWRGEAMRRNEGGGQGGGQGEGQGGTPPAAAEPKPRPKLSDFKGDTEKWSEALADWTEAEIDRKAADKATSTIERSKAKEHAEEAVARWQGAIAEVAKDEPDIYTVLANPKLAFTKTMTDVCLNHEDAATGARVALHLGRNPAEAVRISRMSPARQAAALGKIEAELAKPAQGGGGGGGGQGGGGSGQGAGGGGGGGTGSGNRAPDPPNPVRGSGQGPVDLEKCSLDEYLTARIPGYKAPRRSR